MKNCREEKFTYQIKNEQVKKGSKNQLAFSNRRLPKVADFLTDSLYETGCLGELNGSEPADDLQESRVQSIESAKSLCLCFCLPESCQVELFQFLDYRSITPRDDPLLDNFHNIAPDSERLHYESVVLHWVALTKIVANLRIRALKKALIQGARVSAGASLTALRRRRSTSSSVNCIFRRLLAGGARSNGEDGGERASGEGWIWKSGSENGGRISSKGTPIWGVWQTPPPAILLRLSKEDRNYWSWLCYRTDTDRARRQAKTAERRLNEKLNKKFNTQHIELIRIG